MIICADFWINFWPNFASTVFGLILGLPIAVWTNHLLNKIQVKNQKQIEKDRLIKALTVLRQTMSENKNKLAITISTLNKNLVQFDTQVDGSVWDVVKSEIVQVLHDPGLQKRLAYHFASLTALVDSNRMYLNMNIGINTALTGMEASKEALKNHVINAATFLIVETNELDLLINEKLN